MDPLTPPQTSRPRGFGNRIRAYFFTGLIIAGPLAVTAWIVFWFVNTVDGWIKPLIPAGYWPNDYLPKNAPGVGVVIAFVGLTMLGFLAANLLGRTLLRISETILHRMPVVRGIYKSVKQLFETAFSQEGASFRKVGLIEYPSKGSWAVVFISTPPGPSLRAKLPQTRDYISVFLPCAPNPTTGFYFYAPSEEVIELDMTPDDAMKLIVSAGLIQPNETGRHKN